MVEREGSRNVIDKRSSGNMAPSFESGTNFHSMKSPDRLVSTGPQRISTNVTF